MIRRWAEKALAIDRRWIFLLIAFAVAIPMFLKLVFVVRPSPIVEAIYNKIESLPEGSNILISYDYGPSTVPENQPMADALVRHSLAKGHKVYLTALWATGEAQANETIEKVIKPEFPEKMYGVDWIQLGFKAGGQGVINAIFNDFKGMFNTDAYGTDINVFPMMADIRGLKDFQLIVCIESGRPGLKEWIQFAGDRGDIPVTGGCTAVSAPLYYPYYPRQLLGLMGGLQGAAEYEAAVVKGYPRFARTGLNAVKNMGPQTISHFVIIFFVVLGNIAYFVTRGRGRGRG